jgi:hypothetical protein
MGTSEAGDLFKDSPHQGLPADQAAEMNGANPSSIVA